MTTPTTTVEFVWDRQRIWSGTANRLRSRVQHLRLWSLVTLLVTTVMGAVATMVESRWPVASQVFAGLAGLAVAFAALVRKQAKSSGVPEWTRARVVAEQLKAQVFMFLAGVAPYRDADTARLAGAATATWAQADDLAKFTAPGDGQALPKVTDVDSYVEVRVAGQIERYYRKKVRVYQKRLRHSRIAELTLGGIGLVLGALGGVLGVAGAGLWIATLSTMVAAVAAHSAQQEYEFRHAEYIRTANRLEELIIARAAAGPPTAEDDDKFVADCERVILEENQAWHSRLTARGAQEEP